MTESNEILRERAQWRKGKTALMDKFRIDRNKLLSNVAGKNFTKLPGFAYEALTELEISTKMKVSDLNEAIIRETIERELKQNGIDTDLAYRALAIQWEIDKTNLLNSWSEEYAQIKLGETVTEERLAQLEIEVNKRGTYILQQKTLIEVEAEGYKLQLAQLDGQISPYEVILANQKLLTAQKKLTIIPILQEIVAKEQELLVQEQSKASYYSDLMVAEQEVATKKRTLLQPAISELINESQTYTTELANQILTEIAIANERVTQSQYQLLNIASRVDIAEQDVLIAEANLETENQRLLLQILRDQAENTLLTREISNIAELSAAQSASNANILSLEGSTQSYVLNERRATADLDNHIRFTSNRTLTDAEKTKIQAVTNSRVYADQRIAEINAQATLTANLTHLLG